MPVADIHGHQRKVMRSAVRPVRSARGEGIKVRDGKTLPFEVSRGWNAPAGRYSEQFFIIDPDTREVFYESPTKTVQIWGIQSITDFTDRVTQPVELDPGKYAVVFALGGVLGGELQVEVTESRSEEAA
jgi:hypothetical protein